MALGKILLSTAYLPPISYLKSCISAGNVIIESKEHFIKQTYRNRCNIYGANGLLSLVIPIHHHNLKECPIDEVTMANEEGWKKNHWRSITSAYGQSPFFEFYEEDLVKLFNTGETNLLNFNTECLRLIFKLLKLPLSLDMTDEYAEMAGVQDFRNRFHPKITSTEVFPRYYQVFENRHGFKANLSIIDLICNLGPESRNYLTSLET